MINKSEKILVTAHFLRSINNLATLLSGTGRGEEAEGLYQEVPQQEGMRWFEMVFVAQMGFPFFSMLLLWKRPVS